MANDISATQLERSELVILRYYDQNPGANDITV